MVKNLVALVVNLVAVRHDQKISCFVQKLSHGKVEKLFAAVEN